MTLRTVTWLLLMVLATAEAAPRGGGSPRAERATPARETRPVPSVEPRLTLPPVDPARPAATLLAYLALAPDGAQLRLASRAAEAAAAREATPRAAARGYLAAALAATVSGEQAASRRDAALARQRAQRAADPAAEALAVLLSGRNTEPALELYRRAANAEGQQLARAWLLRSWVQPAVRGSEAALAPRLGPLLAELEAGPRVALADLLAAGAVLDFGDRLRGREPSAADGPSGDSKPWFARAERLASAVGNQHAGGPLLGVVAANLATTARLQLALDTPGPLAANWSARWGTYAGSQQAALAATADPVVLSLGVAGLLANYELNHQVLRRLPDAEPANQAAKAMLGLTIAALPLLEQPPAAATAAAGLLGLPGHHAGPEFGRAACQALAAAVGNIRPDEDPAMESYLDYAFWFYERTKATALARLLARLLNEERLAPETQRRRAALQAERAELAVELLQTALRQRGSGARPAPVARLESYARYQQVRRELLTIELGSDDEARTAAALIDRRFSGAEARRALPDAATAILACGLDWGVLVTAGGSRWFEPEPSSWRRTTELVAALGNPAVAEATRLRAARDLHETYLRPLLPDLAGVTSLIVIPEGPLACLPFEALVSGTSSSDGALPGSWREARFLGERFAIEYLPSLTMMAISRARRRGLSPEQSKVALAVGEVTLPREVEVGDDSTRFVFVPTRSGAENELLALPHTAEEARAVVAAVGPEQSTLLLGPAASLPAVTAALPRHRILHFATHGLLANEHDPLGSALLLSPNADGSPGLLTAREVYSLRLPARLAVLSACDTARGAGRLVSGGVTSLAGAFLYAGVPAVVASLWPVDDEATAQFMKAFYPTMRGDTPGDEARALQAAKAALRQAQGGRWADPYYWAPFLIFR